MSLVTGTEVGLRHEDSLLFGGVWVGPSSMSMFDVIDSETEERLVGIAEAQSVDMTRGVTAARDAFDNGPWLPITRAQYLRAFRANSFVPGFEGV
jgi:aldehyde dehydrogenase (NAD+)